MTKAKIVLSSIFFALSVFPAQAQSIDPNTITEMQAYQILKIMPIMPWDDFDQIALNLVKNNEKLKGINLNPKFLQKESINRAIIPPENGDSFPYTPIMYSCWFYSDLNDPESYFFIINYNANQDQFTVVLADHSFQATRTCEWLPNYDINF